MKGDIEMKNRVVITEETIKEYEANGAVCIRNAVDKSDVETLIAHIDELIDSDKDRWTTSREGGFSDRLLWPKYDWMRQFCTNAQLGEIAGRIMRSQSTRLYFDHLFIRAAGTKQKTPWHQDRPYWPFQGRQIASTWIALSPCTIDTSVLQFVKGSHNWGKVFPPEAFASGSVMEGILDGNEAGDKMPDFDKERDDYEFIHWDMMPGDALVFNAEVIHGAAENNDLTSSRAAISIRYVGDDALWDPRPGTDKIVTAEDTSVKQGEYPADDVTFPLVWKSEA